MVMFEWAMAYLTYDRGAWLITGKLPEVETRALAGPASVRMDGEAAPPP